MGGYSVEPVERGRWRIEVDDFINRVQADWPNANVQFSTNQLDPGLLMWEPWVGREQLFCVFYRSQQEISMEAGSLDACVKVALWYRSLVPAQHRLFFCDEDGNMQVDLQPYTTVQQVMRAARA